MTNDAYKPEFATNYCIEYSLVGTNDIWQEDNV